MVVTLFLILKTGTWNWTPYQIDNGYEIEVVYNKTDKTTTVILYKDGVEIGRVTNPAN